MYDDFVSASIELGYSIEKYSEKIYAKINSLSTGEYVINF